MGIRYLIEVTFIGIPHALRGVPLPLEICSPRGVVQQAVMALEPDSPRVQSVEGPGRYLVRARLPSGRGLAEIGIVPEATDMQFEATGSVTLDLGVDELANRLVSAAANSTRAPLFRGGSRDLPKGVELLTRGLRRGLLSVSEVRDLLPSVLDAAGDEEELAVGSEAGAAIEHASITYGLFHRWHAAESEQAVPRIESLDLRALGRQVAHLPTEIALPQHPGWAAETRKWRPVLVRVENLKAPEGGSPVEAVVVWPPSAGRAALTLLPDPHLGLNLEAPPLLARSQSGGRTADFLFSYVRAGSLEAARQGVPQLLRVQAKEILAEKFDNPVAATVAAYTLFRVADQQHEEWQTWLENLANEFSHLPDGLIILGWHRIRSGQAERARQPFTEALARGLPMYSEGVRLLRSGFNFLQGLFPTDRQVSAGALRAHRIAAAANFDSELTSLRLGMGLAVKMA